jgi:hypothetical protein
VPHIEFEYSVIKEKEKSTLPRAERNENKRNGNRKKKK